MCGVPAMRVEYFFCPADGDAVDVLGVLELHRPTGEVGQLEPTDVEPLDSVAGDRTVDHRNKGHGVESDGDNQAISQTTTFIVSTVIGAEQGVHTVGQFGYRVSCTVDRVKEMF